MLNQNYESRINDDQLYEFLNVESCPPISLLATLLVRANEGRTFFRGAHSVVIVLNGKQSGEKFTILLLISPPGGAPGPHYPAIAFIPLAARSTASKIIRISLSVCSSISLLRELKDSSPKQQRVGANRA